MYLGNIVEILPGEDIGDHAKHPYTQALICSIFDVKMDFSKQIECAEGEIPSPLDLPVGCPFQDRCEECGGLPQRKTEFDFNYPGNIKWSS